MVTILVYGPLVPSVQLLGLDYYLTQCCLSINSPNNTSRAPTGSSQERSIPSKACGGVKEAILFASRTSQGFCPCRVWKAVHTSHESTETNAFGSFCLQALNLRMHAGARIGLIDYGQSKQLPEAERLAFAALLLELGRERADVRPAAVTRCLADLGLRFEREDNQALMTKMAFGMFDTRTSHRCAALTLSTYATPSIVSPCNLLGHSHFI